MGINEAIAAAKAERESYKPVHVPISIGDMNYLVECVKVTGLEYNDIIDHSPAQSEEQARTYGHDVHAAARLATKRHGRLLNEDGTQVPLEHAPDGQSLLPLDWDGIFDSLSPTELTRIAATWWDIHVGEPQRRLQLAKAAAAAKKTASDND